MDPNGTFKKYLNGIRKTTRWGLEKKIMNQFYQQTINKCWFDEFGIVNRTMNLFLSMKNKRRIIIHQLWLVIKVQRVKNEKNLNHQKITRQNYKVIVLQSMKRKYQFEKNFF